MLLGGTGIEICICGLKYRVKQIFFFSFWMPKHHLIAYYMAQAAISILFSTVCNESSSEEPFCIVLLSFETCMHHACQTNNLVIVTKV